jgi:hypothetical protein
MADFDNQVANMVNVGLDPVHTWGDERYFRVINSSNSANSQIDMSLLFDRYYDRPATIDTVIGEEGNYTEHNPVSHTYGCMDDTALNFNADATKDDGSCTFQQQNTTQQTNNSDNNTCIGICDDSFSDSVEDKDEANLVSLTIFMGIIFAIAISVIFISRNREDSVTFVPEMPPLEPPKSD